MTVPQPEAHGVPARLLAPLHDTALAIRFYSRLRVPRLPGETDPHRMPDFGAMARALPVASLVIGLPGALAAAIADFAGLPAMVTGALAIAAGVLATGAFHEDGLADTADGLGGGRTPERRLEIMRDSRIGSFGGAALMLALILRVSLVAALAGALAPVALACTMLALACLSRVCGLIPITLLPSARVDGFSVSVGRPSPLDFGIAVVLGVGFTSALLVPAGLPGAPLWLGMALAVVATLVLVRWARLLIGGQTGDIAGASQQIGEVAIAIGLVAGLGWV